MVKACQVPLQDSIDKTSKFEGSLGAWNVKEKTPSGFGRRVQWSVAYKADILELRSTLGSHIASIALLLNIKSLLVSTFRAGWPPYVISLNVSSETSLTAENERTKNFKKLEAQMEANRALLEDFTAQ